jgi:hypothetical protein
VKKKKPEKKEGQELWKDDEKEKGYMADQHEKLPKWKGRFQKRSWGCCTMTREPI